MEKYRSAASVRFATVILPVAKREEIIHYLAQTVQAQQAPSALYEIRDTCIIYYRK